MEPWQYQPATDLEQSLPERLRHFPRQPDMLVYGLRLLSSCFMRFWLRCYHRLTIHGRENLPGDRSFILVANHCSHLDAMCLLAALPLSRIHRAFPAAAKDYFFVRLDRLTLAAVVMNALPFGRMSHVKESLLLCRHLMMDAQAGNILVIFPEGTRSIDGKLQAFKSGIGLLTAGLDVPVVPCRLEGTAAALPKGCCLPRPGRVTLHIGRPLVFADRTSQRDQADAIALELQQAVGALGGSPERGVRPGGGESS